MLAYRHVHARVMMAVAAAAAAVAGSGAVRGGNTRCRHLRAAASVVVRAILAVMVVYAILMVMVMAMMAAMVSRKFWQNTRTHVERISDTRTLLYYKRCIWI